MGNSDTHTERMVKTEVEIANLKDHVRECVGHFRPSMEGRLRALELKIAYGIGSLGAFQFLLTVGLAIYLKK